MSTTTTRKSHKNQPRVTPNTDKGGGWLVVVVVMMVLCVCVCARARGGGGPAMQLRTTSCHTALANCGHTHDTQWRECDYCAARACKSPSQPCYLLTTNQPLCCTIIRNHCTAPRMSTQRYQCILTGCAESAAAGATSRAWHRLRRPDTRCRRRMCLPLVPLIPTPMAFTLLLPLALSLLSFLAMPFLPSVPHPSPHSALSWSSMWTPRCRRLSTSHVRASSRPVSSSPTRWHLWCPPTPFDFVRTIPRVWRWCS